MDVLQLLSTIKTFPILSFFIRIRKKFTTIKSFKHSSNSLTRESTQHKENLQQHEIGQREE